MWLTSGEIMGTVGVEFWAMFFEIPEDTRRGYLIYDENGIRGEDE